MTITITSDTLSASAGITIPTGNVLNTSNGLASVASRGGIVQTVVKRVDTKSSYSSPSSGNNFITDLDITITPLLKDSFILVRYMITYEVHHDTVMRLARNNKFVGVNGSQQQNDPYNNELPNNNRWQGTFICGYDNDTSTTPFTRMFMYMDRANGDSSITYSIATAGSGGGANTFCLNRAISGPGQDNYENGISMVVVQEIA